MYKWTVCDPLEKDVIEKGVIEKNKILETFVNYPWKDELNKRPSFDGEPFFSPTLEFIDTKNCQAIAFSVVDDFNGLSFYLFYKRPQKVKKWFGLVSKYDPEYVSDLLDQDFNSAKEILEQFLNQKFQELENKF